MRQVSFGQHRGADWLSRVAFPQAGSWPAHERFTLRLQDPHHPRALWVSLALERDGAEPRARCSAVYFDGADKRVQVAEETWPLERANIDPERGGLGIGECEVLPAQSQGLVRGAGFALAWDVAWQGTSPAESLLPSNWLYRHRRLDQKASLPVPRAQVSAGRIEIWHSLGRHAPRTQLDCSGWRASVSHTWGEGGLACHGLAHAHVLEGAQDGAYLHAVAGRTRLLGAFAVEPQLGLLALDGATHRFTNWRSLRGAGIALADPHSLRLSLAANGTTFNGEVRAEPALTARVTGPYGGSLYVSELATLEATWTPSDAPARTVHADKVSLESFASQA